MRIVLGTLVCLGMLASVPARADDADVCAVPAYLLTSDNALPKVSAVVTAHQPLNIVVVGSRSSSLNGPDGWAMSYPARLEAALREKLPGIEVHVTLDLRAKQTAAEVASELEKIVQDAKPALVIWQTGTVDAMRAIDPDDFRTGLDDGIAILQKLNTDVILMNLQYSPRMETMLAVAPYNDTIRVVAQQRGVPMFDRFAIMRNWSEAGDFDLFGAAHGFGMAKRVHDCIGRALSKLVIETAHVNPAALGSQR
ncbi:MAG: SGNH/GDSL hydrolase family protein [Bradyrhizobiaceae bacterium]|nr:MAG: SGNH/GDSL hydrolase family protein [Bradyrhizobiaceae bacterium]